MKVAAGPELKLNDAMRIIKWAKETPLDATSATHLAKTLASELAAAREKAFKEVAKHYPNEIGNMAYCRCGWKGQNWSEHIRALAGGTVPASPQARDEGQT